MKKSFIRFAAIAVLLFASTSTFAYPPDKESRAYEITALDDLNLGKSIQKVWTISYSDEAKPVTVSLIPSITGKEKEYVVRTEFFEVIYVADKDGFGVRKIHGSLKELPSHMNYTVFNKKQMKSQRVLTPNEVSDALALELVGSYLPDLLKDEYKHLIY